LLLGLRAVPKWEGKMRNLHREAAIWYLFASPEFFELAALECEDIMRWFGTLAVSRHVADFGRNTQVYDIFKRQARNFRRGAELARLGDYELAWDTAGCIRGDMRGIMEQPLHSWMTEAEFNEFNSVRTSRLMAYADAITRALENGLWGAASFDNPLETWPESISHDGGFRGEELVKTFNSNVGYYKDQLPWHLPDPLPEYIVDRSVSCRSGEGVPWTGVWFPSTGLERHSLTFAIKDERMQPAYRIIKTAEELRTEDDMFPTPETLAVPTTWHPVIPSGRPAEVNDELSAKAGESCPRAGVWQPTDLGASQRNYEAGEK
jgi:hypothetical protein